MAFTFTWFMKWFDLWIGHRKLVFFFENILVSWVLFNILYPHVYFEKFCGHDTYFHHIYIHLKTYYFLILSLKSATFLLVTFYLFPPFLWAWVLSVPCDPLASDRHLQFLGLLWAWLVSFIIFEVCFLWITRRFLDLFYGRVHADNEFRRGGMSWVQIIKKDFTVKSALQLDLGRLRWAEEEGS